MSFIVTSIENEKNTIEYDENEGYYFGIIDVRDSYKVMNIKAIVKWNLDDENNVEDTEDGISNSAIALPLSVRVEQIN